MNARFWPLLASVSFALALAAAPASATNYAAWADQGVVYTAPAGDAYYPSVIYDAAGFGGGAKYAMWYSDGSGAVFLVKSTDGQAWGAPTTVTGLGNDAHHAQVIYDAACFGQLPCGLTDPKYRIWYWDIDAPLYDITAMATAKSADGVSWTADTSLAQNPAALLVIDNGTNWNRGSYGPVNVFYQATAANSGIDPWNYSYVLYYDGTDGTREQTGLAYSTDGLTWSAYAGNPVLAGSTSAAWDCTGGVYGTVYRDASGWHFWYSGGGGDNGGGGCALNPINAGIGHATSVDGKTWVKDASPIFQISDGVAYRNKRVYTPSVIDDGSGTLKMYFTALATTGPKKIAWATLPVEPAASSGGDGTVPAIRLTVQAPAAAIPGAGIATVDLSVANIGSRALQNISFSPSACASAARVSGDGNGNGLLDALPAETWTYRCFLPVSATTTLMAVVTATGGSSTVSDLMTFTVTVGEAPAATPTTILPAELPAAPTASPSAGSSATIDDDLALLAVAPVSTLCPDDWLVKTGGGDTVYYCGRDGRRHVFPNRNTFLTWYPDFYGVRVVPDAQIAAVPLGQNVTYRPGARLIKMTTDPRVFAVEANGLLRWVTSENLAMALFGPNWSSFVEDLPEAFFADYRLGPSLTADAVIAAPQAATLPAPVPTMLASTPPQSLAANDPLPACSLATPLTAFLNLGSLHPEVRVLQGLLACLGYIGPDVALTGRFGEATLAAVTAFQRDNAIEPRGYVGPATRAALNAYVGR